MNHKILNAKDITFIALMTAIICIAAPFSLPIGVVPVSITNAVLFLSIYILGTKKALLCTILYLLIGLCGLPVFSGFSGGAAKFFGPTGGYLLGFLGMVLIAGIAIDKNPKQRVKTSIFMILGMLFCYLLGTIWLGFSLHMSLKAALFAGVIPFILADLIKIFVISVIGPIVQRHLIRSGILTTKFQAKNEK